ncbi:uncharacterized protein LOC144904866 [Branchiostoma floridae x Branchiostoma belcheri]
MLPVQSVARCLWSCVLLCVLCRSSAQFPSLPDPNVSKYNCPAGWTYNTGSCYRLLNITLSRNKAQGACARYGARLADLQGYGETSFISNLASQARADVTDVWIGYKLDSSDNRYAGQWAPNQPDPNLSCTSVNVQEAQWYTRPCQTSLLGVCKADACLDGQVRCVSGRCIPAAARCDGAADCEDGTDEVNCANCGGTLTGSSGTIQSPGYPQEYNTSLDCLWIIQTAEGQRLNLTFKDFELEDEFDTLTVSSQPFQEETSQLFSGDTSSPDSIIVSSNIALVRLRTDWNGAAKGFWLDWRAFEVSGCGGQLSVSTGSDVAIDFPAAPGLDCDWVLSAPGGDVITLVLQTGRLAGQGSYVEVFDGESVVAPSLAKFGAGHVSGIVTSTSNKMAVKMVTSDEDTVQPGLTAKAITGCQATLSDVVYGQISIGTDPYKSGVDCTYTVQSSQSQPLLLSPEGIDEGDVLQVRAGDGAAVNYDNNNLPPSIRAEDGSFRINYISAGNPLMATISVDCPDPQTLLTSSEAPVTIIGSNTEYGATAELRCSDGYVSDYFNGSLTLQCSSGGAWKEVGTAKLMDMAIPDDFCKPLDCGEPPVIPQGYYVKNGGTLLKSSVTYTCFSAELMLIGDNNITCQETGEWSQPPLCQAPACVHSVRDGTLMVVRGDQRGDQFSNGAVVRVECDPGFEPDGTDESFCQLGIWRHNKGSAPQCKRRKCAMPAIENLDVNPMDEYYSGDTVLFNCSAGYSLNSTDNLNLTCQNDGYFAGRSVNCTDIDECVDGSHQCSDNTVCVNTEGGYWCDCLPGYYKDQPMDRMCVDIDECAMNNGGCSDTCTNFAGGYNCTCTRPGYQLFTFNGQYGVNVREGETGHGVTDVLRFNQSCVPVPCGPLPNLTNGFYNDFKSGSYVYGDNITYHCEKGFMMTGDPIFTCGVETEGDLPMCNVAVCPMPDTIMNGTVSAPVRPAYRSNVTYMCDEGFVLMGSGVRYCDNIGAGDNVTYGWTGMQPTCQLVDCWSLPLPPGGVLVNTSSTNTTYGSIWTVSCLPGFQVQGDQLHVCQANGRWSGAATRCIPTSCPDPGTPAGGQQDTNNYDVGTVLTFSCNRTGYGPSHSRGLTCSIPEGAVDPVFNDTIPECVDVEPPDFGDSCPQQLSVDLGPNGFLPTVFYQPNATDNSGEQIQVISDPPGFFGIDVLPNDTDVLMFKAMDTSNRTSVCAIELVINDIVPPTIDCPANHVTPSNGSSTTLTYPAAVVSDNVQVARVTYQPAAGGVIGFGEAVQVKATAYDSSNNSASCVFTVQAAAPACSQDSLDVPDSVQRNYLGFVQADNVYKYEVSCPQPMAFAEGDLEETTRTYTCTVDNGWQIEGRTASYVPGCTAKTAADQQMGFVVTMATTNGNIPSTCASHYQTSVSNHNINDDLQAALLRKCRDIPVPDVTVLLTGHRLNVQQSDLTINFTIQVSPNSASTLEDHVISCLTSLRNTIAGVPGAEVPEPNTSYRFRTWLDNVVSGSVGGTQCPSLTRTVAPAVAPEYMRDGDSESMAVCNRGESPVSGFCLPCTPGTYQAVPNGPCISCPAGSYQNASRAVSCNTCPPDTWTARQNSWTKDACTDMCPVGQYSPTRVAPCNSCPRGTYASQMGTERCTDCPDGTSTSQAGQDSRDACAALCPAGSFAIQGVQPHCQLCPKNFYQPMEGATACRRCPGGNITVTAGATSLENCIDYDWCENPTEPCQNGGSCVDRKYGYTCTCPSGYLGDYCEIQRSSCQSSPCYNGGTCQDRTNGYSCTCPAGFGGLRCEDDLVDACSGGNPCQNGGKCRDLSGGLECVCVSGYTGISCEQQSDECSSNPCLNGGTCTDELNGYTCQCAEGFRGSFCQLDQDACLSSPCQNGGQCWNLPGPGFICNCTTGFDGQLCEVDIDECSSSPCQNSAQCVDGKDGYKCLCKAGWYGDRCQNNTDDCTPNPCLNNGTCVDSVQGFRCECQPGYGGSLCQTDVDDCEENACQNGARCIDGMNQYSCNCTEGWTGTICDEDVDDCINATCLNDGICRDGVNSYTCDCPNGYTGNNCSIDIDECESSPCLYGSTCIDGINGYTCNCSVGYTGDNCSVNIPDCQAQTCSNGGTCIDLVTGFSCSCAVGWTGPTCTEQYQYCQTVQCRNGGTCTSQNGRHNCSCPEGFYGELCQFTASSCRPNPCQHGGKCTPGSSGDSYTCQCRGPFTGTNCETGTQSCAGSGTVCQNGGTCVDDGGVRVARCRCTDFYYGKTCHKEKSADFDMLFSGAEATTIAPAAVPVQQEWTACSWVRFSGQQQERTGTVMTVLGYDQGSNQPETAVAQFTDTGLQLPGGTFMYNSTIVDGKWHHLCTAQDRVTGVWKATQNGNTFASGTAAESNPTSQMFGNRVQLVLGDFNDTTPPYFRGEITQANLWNGSLSDQRLRNLWESKESAVGTALPWVAFDDPSATKGRLQVPRPSLGGTTSCPQGVTGSSCQSVIDKTAPSITSCPGTTTVNSDKVLAAGLSWPQPEFDETDVRIQASHRKNQTFTWGTYPVSYLATDNSNISAVCSFNLHVTPGQCRELAAPRNGRADCRRWSGGLVCNISCNTGYSFSQPTQPFYTCGPEGLYDVNQPNVPFQPPNCARASEADSGIQFIRMNFDTEPCTPTNQRKVLYKVANKLDELHRTYNICVPFDSSTGMNNTFSNISCDITRLHAVCKSDIEGILQRQGIGRVKRQTTGVSTTGSLPVQGPNVTAALDSLKDPASLTQLGADPNTALLASGLSCPAGQVLQNSACVECSIGTYYSTGLCLSCPKGTYNDAEGQLACKTCPSGQTTASTGSTTSAQCIATCQAGSYWNGTSCVTCARGTYQDETGQLACKSCLAFNQGTTAAPGATSSADCLACPVGEELKPDGSCQPCPKNSYRENQNLAACTPCPSGFLTVSSGSSKSSDCYQDINECTAGTVDPCLNYNGVCQDLPQGYRCSCNPGYVNNGETRCKDACDGYCQRGTCSKSSTQQPVCTCPRGFHGTICDKRRQLTTGEIVGIVLGSLAALILLIVLLYCCIKWLNTKGKEARKTPYGITGSNADLMYGKQMQVEDFVRKSGSVRHQYAPPPGGLGYSNGSMRGSRLSLASTGTFGVYNPSMQPDSYSTLRGGAPQEPGVYNPMMKRAGSMSSVRAGSVSSLPREAYGYSAKPMAPSNYAKSLPYDRRSMTGSLRASSVVDFSL